MIGNVERRGVSRCGGLRGPSHCGTTEHVLRGAPTLDSHASTLLCASSMPAAALLCGAPSASNVSRGEEAALLAGALLPCGLVVAASSACAGGATLALGAVGLLA